MSDQPPARHPAHVPGAYAMYAPPQARPVTGSYRRWAGILVLLAALITLLMAVALVLSFVLLAQADANAAKAAHGYGAIFLWFGIAAAAPVLLAVGVPGVVMTRRVRHQRRAG
ncbi:hypothetical protein ABZ434_09165 [Streptomyces sp. NPDC005761]|uniref:hypothetical protein n=1 Tax=unclassified Streptomyces TaxID=2593676 RepID=UPI0034064242